MVKLYPDKPWKPMLKDVLKAGRTQARFTPDTFSTKRMARILVADEEATKQRMFNPHIYVRAKGGRQ